MRMSRSRKRELSLTMNKQLQMLALNLKLSSHRGDRNRICNKKLNINILKVLIDKNHHPNRKLAVEAEFLRDQFLRVPRIKAINSFNSKARQ